MVEESIPAEDEVHSSRNLPAALAMANILEEDQVWKGVSLLSSPLQKYLHSTRGVVRLGR